VGSKKHPERSRGPSESLIGREWLNQKNQDEGGGGDGNSELIPY